MWEICSNGYKIHRLGLVFIEDLCDIWGLWINDDLLHTALTHWGWVTNICISKLTIIGLDNGLSPGRCHYTPRTTKLLGGYTGFTPSVRPSVRLSVRPSVCPSVRPSVRPACRVRSVSSTVMMDSFHIRHKWSLPWEGVSCTMTFDLDLYLQGRSALT